ALASLPIAGTNAPFRRKRDSVRCATTQRRWGRASPRAERDKCQRIRMTLSVQRSTFDVLGLSGGNILRKTRHSTSAVSQQYVLPEASESRDSLRQNG